MRFRTAGVLAVGFLVAAVVAACCTVSFKP